MNPPLILTLQLNPQSQSHYDRLRRRFYPPERNRIPAHLTLFHQLLDEDFTRQALEQAARTTSVVSLTHPAARSIGRGVAVFFQSPPVSALHAALASLLYDTLIPQDRQRFHPHIVIQNKVDSETAQSTLRQLDPHLLLEPQAIGLTLWRYLGGPWQHLLDYPFAAAPDPEPSISL